MYYYTWVQNDLAINDCWAQNNGLKTNHQRWLVRAPNYDLKTV